MSICKMPEMDGYEATEVIRRFANDRKDIPIIAMTASAIRGDRERCIQVGAAHRRSHIDVNIFFFQAGMSDYLAKPVKRVNLEAMIMKWLHAAGKAAGNQSRILRPGAPIPSPSFAQVASRTNSTRPATSSPLSSPMGSPPTPPAGPQSSPTTPRKKNPAATHALTAPQATPIASLTKSTAHGQHARKPSPRSSPEDRTPKW